MTDLKAPKPSRRSRGRKPSLNCFVWANDKNTPVTWSPAPGERVHQPAVTEAFMGVEQPRLAAPAPVGEGMSATWRGVSQAGTGIQR